MSRTYNSSEYYIRSTPSFAFKVQNCKFTMKEFPKQQRWKQKTYPRENCMKVLEVWEEFHVNEAWGWILSYSVTFSWVNWMDEWELNIQPLFVNFPAPFNKTLQGIEQPKGSTILLMTGREGGGGWEIWYMRAWIIFKPVYAQGICSGHARAWYFFSPFAGFFSAHWTCVNFVFDSGRVQ